MRALVISANVEAQTGFEPRGEACLGAHVDAFIRLLAPRADAEEG